jgi:choline dehydrogenase-like flavoprotein
MTDRSFDAIVVGARAAGSSTAMLLARTGMRVLAVDRAAFPSDTISTHQVQLPGVAMLCEEMGETRHVAVREDDAPRLRQPEVPRRGRYARRSLPGVRRRRCLYSPRRTVLDTVSSTPRARRAPRSGELHGRRDRDDGRVVTGSAAGRERRAVRAPRRPR